MSWGRGRCVATRLRNYSSVSLRLLSATNITVVYKEHVYLLESYRGLSLIYSCTFDEITSSMPLLTAKHHNPVSSKHRTRHNIL